MKKMRKILPLVLLVIASVFMLSSCDALLDAIFANNTINVQVSAYIPYYAFFPAYDTVTVYITGPTNVTVNASYTGNDGYYMYWYVSVPKLSNGTYNVYSLYSHPFGNNTGSHLSLSYPVSLPVGNSHTAYVGITYP
jgi:hypothetical protein